MAILTDYKHWLLHCSGVIIKALTSQKEILNVDFFYLPKCTEFSWILKNKNRFNFRLNRVFYRGRLTGKY